MIPANIQVLQTDALAHRLTQTWTGRLVAVGLAATHRVAHHAEAAQDLVRLTMTAIQVPAVRSTGLAEDHVHHPGLALAMATLAITAQMNHVLNPAGAPDNPQALAQVQISGTMTLETTCTPLVRNLEVLALTTDAHVVTVGARAVAEGMTLMK
ncbi:unnamed protein product [marine sediment metagenome]|uniref:Uncharacterized protein n=1 Tax=marine sediment metagenome TaxID=412755 RepID=X1TS46_9ZZZZ